MSESSRAHRVAPAVVVPAAVAVLALLAWWVLGAPSVGKVTASTDKPEPPGTSATAVVDQDGFRIDLAGGVEVTAGPGVAPAGTEVRAALIEGEVPGDFGTFASAVSPLVDVELGDRLQPQTPIAIAFELSDDTVQSVGTDRLFVLGESATEGRDVDFVESDWDASTSTVTATVDHLSWYALTHVDDESLGNQMGDWLDQQAAVRTAKPACVDEPTGPSGSFVLASPWPDSAWVCASESDDAVSVALQSNSGLVFNVETEPGGEYSPLTALGVTGIATAEVATLLERAGMLEGSGVLLAGETTTVDFAQPFDSADVSLKVDPGLSQISSIMFGVGMLLPEEWAATLDWYECVVDTLGTLDGGPLAQAVLGCVGAAASGTASGLLGIIATGPGLLFTQVEGLVREVTATNVESFTVRLVSPEAIRELPAGASWLFEHAASRSSSSGEEDIATVPTDDGAAATYPFSTNQWISCTRSPSSVRYDLDGEWSELSYGFALQTHTPDGLTASIEIYGDGELLDAFTTTRGDALSRTTLDVTGVQELTVEAITEASCGPAPKGYGAMVQAYLS